MKYAVVKIGGKQYKVNEGELVVVDRLSQKEGTEAEFPQVLLSVDEGKVEIGQPNIPEFKVRVLVEKHFRGEKIRVAKFKAKSRYRKVIGFRPDLTRIKILKTGKVDEKADNITKQEKKVDKRRLKQKRV